jgi:hypothetical protein
MVRDMILPMSVTQEAPLRFTSWPFGMREYGKPLSVFRSATITVAVCVLLWLFLDLIRYFVGRSPAIFVSLSVFVVSFIAIVLRVRSRRR